MAENWQYSPTGVLGRLSQVLGCKTGGIETRLVEIFGGELPQYPDPEKRLDAIRSRFNPGEGNELTSYIQSIIPRK